MDKKILLTSLLNGVFTWLIASLLIHLLKGTSLMDALKDSYVIIASLAAAIGTYVGSMRKKKK